MREPSELVTRSDGTWDLPLPPAVECPVCGAEAASWEHSVGFELVSARGHVWRGNSYHDGEPDWAGDDDVRRSGAPDLDRWVMLPCRHEPTTEQVKAWEASQS
jgi:hypothetical protein